MKKKKKTLFPCFFYLRNYVTVVTFNFPKLKKTLISFFYFFLFWRYRESCYGIMFVVKLQNSVYLNFFFFSLLCFPKIKIPTYISKNLTAKCNYKYKYNSIQFKCMLRFEYFVLYSCVLYSMFLWSISFWMFGLHW